MAYYHLTKSSRMELSLLHNKGYSVRAIAATMKLHPSSISRELKKNALATGSYDPGRAQEKAQQRRQYSKFEGMKISKEPWLKAYVQKKLETGWTPEQISGRLKHDYERTILSFKTIYKWIYSSAGQAYAKFLPSKRYRPYRRNSAVRISGDMIKNRVSIEARPSLITGRTRIGDFEGDTLGKPKHCSETLVGVVDRCSRYLLAKKVASLKRTMKIGYRKLLKNVRPYSLTLDNGVENANYEILKIPTYFCHPYSAWEKGTIENTFQRLRRFIPKKANLSLYSDDIIAEIIHTMNNTPRKCLNYQTPEEVFTGQKRVLHLGV